MEILCKLEKKKPYALSSCIITIIQNKVTFL